MAVERPAVHAGRCPTAQWSRPRARVRSPAAAHRDVGRTGRRFQRVTCSGCRRWQRECEINAPALPRRTVGARPQSTWRWIVHLDALSLALVLLAAPLVAGAQPPGKMPRIGVLL